MGISRFCGFLFCSIGGWHLCRRRYREERDNNLYPMDDREDIALFEFCHNRSSRLATPKKFFPALEKKMFLITVFYLLSQHKGVISQKKYPFMLPLFYKLRTIHQTIVRSINESTTHWCVSHEYPCGSVFRINRANRSNSK